MKQSPLSRISFLSLLTALYCVFFVTTDAWATASGLSDVTKNLGTNVRNSVPLIPMMSYVAGVFFAATGLLKLKDWVADGERNSITPALVRLIVAVFLILLPHVIRLTTGTFFRRADGSMDVNIRTPAPSLKAFCKSSNPNC